MYLLALLGLRLYLLRHHLLLLHLQLSGLHLEGCDLIVELLLGDEAPLEACPQQFLALVAVLHFQLQQLLLHVGLVGDDKFGTLHLVLRFGVHLCIRPRFLVGLPCLLLHLRTHGELVLVVGQLLGGVGLALGVGFGLCVLAGLLRVLGGFLLAVHPRTRLVEFQFPLQGHHLVTYLLHLLPHLVGAVLQRLSLLVVDVAVHAHAQRHLGLPEVVVHLDEFALAEVVDLLRGLPFRLHELGAVLGGLHPRVHRGVEALDGHREAVVGPCGVVGGGGHVDNLGNHHTQQHHQGTEARFDERRAQSVGGDGGGTYGYREGFECLDTCVDGGDALRDSHCALQQFQHLHVIANLHPEEGEGAQCRLKRSRHTGDDAVDIREAVAEVLRRFRHLLINLLQLVALVGNLGQFLVVFLGALLQSEQLALEVFYLFLEFRNARHARLGVHLQNVNFLYCHRFLFFVGRLSDLLFV